MTLCGYCNSKKLFRDIDRHKCEKRQIAKREKLVNEVYPYIRKIIKSIIELMIQDYDMLNQIPPVLIWDSQFAIGSTDTEIIYKQLHLDSMIDEVLDGQMFCLRYYYPRYILENSVEDISKTYFEEKNDSLYYWKYACSNILCKLYESGINVFKDEHYSKFCNSYGTDFTLLEKNFEMIVKYGETVKIIEPPKKYQPTTHSNVVLYLRVSTSSQSSDYQNKALLTYCANNNIRVTNTFEDVGSARVLQNDNSIPRFTEMIDQIPKNTCILVTTIDRFGRNVEYVKGVIEKLHEKGCYVFSICNDVSSHDEKFMEKIRDAEATSNDMSERMKMIKM